MTQKPITQLLFELREGGRDAIDQLLPLVYDELRRLARHHLSGERREHTLQPTALVNEAYIRLIGQKEVDWKDRSHFFGVASRLMREILIEYARGRNRKKRGAGCTMVVLDDVAGESGSHDLDIIAVDEALKKLEQVDERQAKVVEMKFFGGLSINEIAEACSISPATVKREWQTAKLFLSKMLDTRC
jgi:RNA polymerase sigma-70 factor (ECF subfamily)